MDLKASAYIPKAQSLYGSMNLSEGRTNISHLQTGSDVGNSINKQETYFNVQNPQKFKSYQGSHDLSFQFGLSKHFKDNHSNDFTSPTFAPESIHQKLISVSF